MILQIFTVYDSAAEAYLQPFFFRTPGEALRAFAVACREDGHQFHQHSKDYTLFHIGQFHQNTAEIESFAAARALGNALEYARDVNDLLRVENDG